MGNEVTLDKGKHDWCASSGFAGCGDIPTNCRWDAHPCPCHSPTSNIKSSTSPSENQRGPWAVLHCRSGRGQTRSNGGPRAEPRTAQIPICNAANPPATTSTYGYMQVFQYRNQFHDIARPAIRKKRHYPHPLKPHTITLPLLPLPLMHRSDSPPDAPPDAPPYPWCPSWAPCPCPSDHPQSSRSTRR